MSLRRNEPVVAALLFVPLLAGLVLMPHPAAAAPLEPEACTALKTERQGLIADGVKTDMSKGPDWAKANLAADRLGKIERLIAVEEQLSFRCDDLVTAKPQMKEPPKQQAKNQAQGDDKAGDKQASNPASDTANASASAPADPSAAVQKPKKKTVSKVKKKPVSNAAN